MHTLCAIHESDAFNSWSGARIHENAVFNSLKKALKRAFFVA